MSTKSVSERSMEQGKGILRFTPTWVPRLCCVPGKRIKLHPDDYYALGGQRGGIVERWLSSTTPADNGPFTSHNEGLSFVVFEANGKIEQVLLPDAINHLKGDLIGERLWNEYGCWPVYSKFFDNKHSLPYHMHQRDEHAALVGQRGKPEAYYFPPQLNNHRGDFSYTFFGFQPGTTKEQVKECLVNFTKGDNNIINLSRAYRLEPGTGWDVPPGVLHAPGSLCTYEPQKASDIFTVYQSLVGDQIVLEEQLWKNIPPDKIGDYDYLIEVLDWELNVDANFEAHRFMRPKPVKKVEEMNAEGYMENWICYRSTTFSAKELMILPGRTVTIYDNAAYGLIMTQGHGKMGVWDIETPMLIHYGQLTHDEFFVSEAAAQEGVTIRNLSRTDPVIMLKHFGPDNPDIN